MTTSSFLGIDVSKGRLDLGAPDRLLRGFDNSKTGISRLVRYCHRLHKKAPIACICVESTGCYSRAGVDALHEAGFPVCLVQPNRVRAFAQSAGVLAKTDAIDAVVIARFGERLSPREYTPPSAANARLRALVDRRDQVVDDRIRENNRLEACLDTEVAKQIRRHIALLGTEEERLDQLIADVIDQDEELATKRSVLMTVPGVATVTIGVLLAYLPELGKVNRQHIAALAGVAPYDNSSGKRRAGKRSKEAEGAYAKRSFSRRSPLSDGIRL